MRRRPGAWPAALALASALPMCAAAQPATLFDDLQKAGFRLQRSVAGRDATEAAQFSFLRSFDRATIYRADFAVIWGEYAIGSLGAFDFNLKTSVEGALTSDESESEDAVRVRGTLSADAAEIGFLDSIYSEISLKHESDQDFDAQKLMAELLVSPTVDRLSIGQRSGAKASALQFRWRPYLGLDVGTTLDEGDSAERESQVLRLVARGRIELYLNAASRILGFQETFLYADYHYYFLPLERESDNHQFLAAGLEFLLTEHFSFDLVFKWGEAPPRFQQIKTFGGAIGLRF